VLRRPAWSTIVTGLIGAENMLVLACAGLLAVAVVYFRRRGLSSAWRTVLIVSVATVLATAAVIALKYAFGRLWPETWIENNPSWISNHEFGFRPFHGGAGYESFPSGHTARITAPFAVLWQRLPRYRVVWVLAPLLVMAGLLAADFHFLSDCIAGIYVGIASAVVAVMLV
jgi:membrane-associated phospholipid phosphatase